MKIVEIIKSSKYKEMCNPDIYYVAYCKDFLDKYCPKTCVHAKFSIKKLERVVGEDRDF